MSHYTHFIRLAKCPILRSGKRGNSGGSEGSVQDSPSGYVSSSYNQPIFSFPTTDHSQELPLGGGNESGNGGENGGRQVYG